MSIRPIDFNGMIQSSIEVSHTKANENQRAELQQAGIGVVFEHEEQHEKQQVNQMEAMDEQGYDREGNGQGFSRNKNGQKKKTEKGNTSEGDGKVSIKSAAAHKSFDVKI